MYVKGRIGECVLIKATIEKIDISGTEDIIYGVRVVEGNTTMNYLRSEDILFHEDTLDENIQEEQPDPEYNDDIIPDSASGLPVDDEWSRPAPKKRGRPRKATVEDLITKAKGGAKE